MAQVILVHGVGQQYRGAASLGADLGLALADGVTSVGSTIQQDDIAVSYYGSIFRPDAEYLGHVESDSDEAEEEFLLALWRNSAEVDKSIFPPDIEALSRFPQIAKRVLSALDSSAIFGGLVGRALVGELRQLSRYLENDDIRSRVQDSLAGTVTADTRLIIGHSLGSVVAYETLCANLKWPPHTLITLGSPIGYQRLVFERLRPAPLWDPVRGRRIGIWPGSALRWVNVFDPGDIVAARTDLRLLFGDRVEQISVHNGPKAHEFRTYLSSPGVGAQVVAALG